jgi:hypothetical protein
MDTTHRRQREKDGIASTREPTHAERKERAEGKLEWTYGTAILRTHPVDWQTQQQENNNQQSSTSAGVSIVLPRRAKRSSPC